MNEQRAWDTPEQVFHEYRAGVQYKANLGEKGLYRQNEINRRFFSGDQWYGAKCGGERPLVRHNVIRRIGEYKMSAVGGAPVAVTFSADGVPDTIELREKTRRHKRLAAAGNLPMLSGDEEVELMMSAFSDYFAVTAERVKLDSLLDKVLRQAYCTGTGVLYTYWDEHIKTGLYADERRTAPIAGDIACEVLDIENVYFGDPTVDDVQKQPFVMIVKRMAVSELRRLAQHHGRSDDEIAAIRPDRDEFTPACEPEGEGKALLLTKFYKEYAADGSYRIMAVQVCRGVTVRGAWDIGLRCYPLAVFRWDSRYQSAYGESEITHLIPNQIAINRMQTSSVWGVLMQGMPTLVVNGDVVQQPVTNDPGQVIRVFGTGDDVRNAMGYVEPPAFSAALDSTLASLMNNTLAQNGANAAALGDISPDNTSAIIAVREAAMMPLNAVRLRFHAFCEEVARQWAEFWVTGYGKRALKIADESGVWYLPFDGMRYRNLLINARVDVGSATLWSESQAVLTLDNLLQKGVITVEQYLKRLPKGTIPDMDGLLRELENLPQEVTV